MGIRWTWQVRLFIKNRFSTLSKSGKLTDVKPRHNCYSLSVRENQKIVDEKIEIRSKKMEERILVPLDGSEVGEAVLPKLEDLVLKATPKMEAEVTLLRVISKMNFNVLTQDEKAQLPIPEEDMVKMTQEAQDYLSKVGEGLTGKGIKVKTLVTFGHPAEEIVKTARETKAHLIAMSTHGRSGIVRWAIGSVTNKVMRLEGQIPVLAVNAAGNAVESQRVSLSSLQSLPKNS
jgi:nucleotide-binding universal stress UspA family protein